MAMFIKTTYSSAEGITANKPYFMNSMKYILSDEGIKLRVRSPGKICAHLDGKGTWEEVKGK